MATETTARPYAKAAFEFALEKGELAKWAQTLELLASISLDSSVQAMIATPQVEAEDSAKLFIEVGGSHLDEHAQNFVHLLAHNRRLLALSAINALFQQLKQEQEKSLLVEVTAFAELSQAQQEALSEKLKTKLNRDISLNITIDESILGGAIIRAGSLLIDGSVRGKLNKLSTELAA